MKHASLFSGIGGFDLAAEWMGWENVFHCEIKEFNKQILKYYWPDAITYSDIKQTDFTVHRGEIDILTGGFPCQPYSVAGKRKGKEDDRHLWPEMLRAIREIQPRYIVGENVFGLLSWNGGIVFDEVQADLEAEGYEVQPVILPACAVNAPHRRDRIWFIAYSNGNRNNNTNRTKNDIREYEDKIKAGNRRTGETTGSSNEWTTTNTCCYNGWVLCGQKTHIGREIKKYGQHCNPCTTRPFAHSSILRRRQINREGKSRIINKISKKPNWNNFPTQSPICDGNDGFSTGLDFKTIFAGIDKPRKKLTFNKWRTESIMGGGNAIVPQIAYEIFKAIVQTNTVKSKH